MTTVFLYFLAAIAVVALAFVFVGLFFTRAAIRAGKRAAAEYTATPCDEKHRDDPLPDVRGSRLDSRTDKLEKL